MQDKVKMTFLGGEERDVEDVLDCIGPGWRPLVRKLILDLFAEGWDGEVAQIKEKFGGLRFYADNVPAGRGEELIYEAEEASTHICEECGQPGELRSGGWLRTLCDEHANGSPVAKYSDPTEEWFKSNFGDDEFEITVGYEDEEANGKSKEEQLREEGS